MKNLNKLVCAGAVLTLGFNTLAATIYDDYAGYSGNSFSVTNGQEVGNEISITPGVWSLTNFSIEYHTPDATLSTSVGIDVRFYLNDATPVNGFATPGTLFFDSGWFYNTALGGLPGNTGPGGNNGFNIVTYNSSDFYGGSVVNLTGPYLQLPGKFTFTITFTNLNPSNLIDLPLANNQLPISVGDYWLNNGGGAWTLMTNSTSAANFVADFAGTVPEPSMLGLGALGGALLLGINQLRRKR